MKRIHIVITCCLLLVVGTAVLVINWLTQPAEQQIAYTNVSRNARVCVVSTSADVAAPVWHAVQSAAGHDPVNAQQLIAPTGQPDQLVPFVNGVLALNCRLIIATGTGIHDVIRSTAKANPHQDFAADGRAISLPNVQHITDQTQISDMVHAAATR